MRDVIFDVISAYNDLHLILNNKTIAAPSVKVTSIDIPGGDGALDFTEYFGKVNYNNRKLTLEFSTVVTQNEFLNLFSHAQNILHGRKMKVYLSDDPNFYYYGRITLSEWKANKRIGKLTIEVDAEPYKYKESVTTILRTITGPTNIICSNLHKEVVPKIIVDKETSITFGTYTKVFSAGEYIDDNIIFTQGLNELKATPTSGSVAIRIEYQERGL